VNNQHFYSDVHCSLLFASGVYERLRHEQDLNPLLSGERYEAELV